MQIVSVNYLSNSVKAPFRESWALFHFLETRLQATKYL